ncbi:MAG: flagellar protein FlaG [Actinomycetota bacterium]|nr:flagellar protein FlaG [Actinomycetota bacterium]
MDPAAKAPSGDRVELSSTPPPDALAEVDRAFERVSELAAQNRELHFSRDEASGRIIVQVRDMEGHVLRTIPNSEALHVMAGAELH